MVDLVILDVNETLFSLDPVADRFAAVGLEGRLELWFAWVLRDGIAATAAGRSVTFVEVGRHHLTVLLERAGQAATDARVDHVIEGFGEVRPHDDVADGLRRLAEAGVDVVTLTNGSTDISLGFLERAGLETLVADLHDVQETGRWKPAPEPYLAVLAGREVPADRAALVAVHPWDVQGAQAAGLVGAWLDRQGSVYPSFLPAPDVQASTLPLLVDQLLEA